MLDENGFKRKTYDELLTDMETKAKELFGEDANLSPHSVLGILFRVLAWFLALSHELAERVYNSGFISKSTGVQLDRHGNNLGVLRDVEMPAEVTLVFEGKPGYVIEEGVQFQTENEIIFEMVDVVTIDESGRGQGLAVSQVYASNSNVPAGSITISVEPVEEITAVINPEPATGGSDREADTNYRARIKLATNSTPGPPINGIISALNEVPSVRSASVIENNTMQIDEKGNPPKSIHVFCFGGKDEEVADAIFNAVAAGIETVGSKSVTVKDISGFEKTVKFDYANSINIFSRVTINVSSQFEKGAESDVKAAVYNYINNLNMGDDVIHSYIYPGVYQVPGILVAKIEIGKSSNALNPSDIDIQENESAQILMENIEVIINGG